MHTNRHESQDRWRGDVVKQGIGFWLRTRARAACVPEPSITYEAIFDLFWCCNRLDFSRFHDIDCPVSHLSHRHDARTQKIFLPKPQPNAHVLVPNSGRETQ